MTENDKPQGEIMVEGGFPAETVLVLVYATFPDLASAEAAARVLVEAKHAGCVNILPGMVSLYSWKGALERSGEVVLIAKTSPQAARACMEAIANRHPYETPAILALPVTAGSQAYLSWVRSGTLKA